MSESKNYTKICESKIYTMGYYAAERKKELLPFTSACMELESIIHQAVKDKYHMISPISGT